MQEIKKLAVDLEARLIVDRTTAEACLKIVELYVNNTGAKVVVHEIENRKVRFCYDEPFNERNG